MVRSRQQPSVMLYRLDGLRLAMIRDVNSDLSTLQNKAARFRRKSKINFGVYPNLGSKYDTDELIAISRTEVKTNLSLSMVRLIRSAKRWKNKFVRQRYRPVSVVRNEQMLEDFRNYRN